MIKKTPMTVKSLKQGHAEYNPDSICRRRDFYEGGDRFQKNILKYLRLREADKIEAFAKNHTACAKYIAHLPGKIDGLVGGALRKPPEIAIANPDDRAQYWLNLNSDADGAGKDLAALARIWLLHQILLKRAYIIIKTPAIAAIAGESVQQAKDRKRLDCTLSFVLPDIVDLWEKKAGAYVWIRTKETRDVRENDIGRVIKKITRWSYFEADAVTYYEVEVDVDGAGTAAPLPDDKEITPVQTPHDLKALPIIPLEPPEEFDVGGRLLPICELLFNREAAREFALDSAAFAVPVVLTEKPVDKMMVNEQNVVSPGLAGDFKFASPEGAVFTAQKEDVGDLKAALDDTIAAMADQARDRVSGVAAHQFRDKKDVLLSIFTMPVIDGIQKACNVIADYRRETDLKPTAKGLDEFEPQATEVLITGTGQFMALPDMPKTPRIVALRQVIKSFVTLTPDEEKETEIQLTKIPDQATIAGAPPNDGNPLNKKTGAPDKFGADQIRQSVKTN